MGGSTAVQLEPFILVQLEACVVCPRCSDSRPRKAKHSALGLGGLLTLWMEKCMLSEVHMLSWLSQAAACLGTLSPGHLYRSTDYVHNTQSCGGAAGQCTLK
jgi:hypothetical protein